MFFRDTMRYGTFAFWVIVVGLVAARVAYHDRITAGTVEQPRPAAHALSTMPG